MQTEYNYEPEVQPGVLEFTYRVEHLPEATPGLRTYNIRLWWDEKSQLRWSRTWIGEDGKKKGTPISCIFGASGVTAPEVAKLIHWDCCGWAAGLHQIWQLVEMVERFLSQKQPLIPTPQLR